jgi:hypothetical protein
MSDDQQRLYVFGSGTTVGSEGSRTLSDRCLMTTNNPSDQQRLEVVHVDHSAATTDALGGALGLHFLSPANLIEPASGIRGPDSSAIAPPSRPVISPGRTL